MNFFFLILQRLMEEIIVFSRYLLALNHQFSVVSSQLSAISEQLKAGHNQMRTEIRPLIAES